MDIRSLDISQLTRQEPLDLIGRPRDSVEAAIGEPRPGERHWPREPKAFVDALQLEVAPAFSMHDRHRTPP